MNEQEARAELEKLSTRKFAFRSGIGVGLSVAVVVLGFSFVRPHWDYIITLGFYPALAYALYLTYIKEYKLKKISRILQDSKDPFEKVRETLQDSEDSTT